MGRKRVPGLIMRAGIWHIDKRILGRRVCQSTGTAQLEEAERNLARVMEETRQAQIYGVRPARTFEQAAAKFVLENQHKRSLASDIVQLKLLDAVDLAACRSIGSTAACLQPWIEQRRRRGQGCRHDQPRPEDRPAHSEPCGSGVGGRARPDLAAGGAEDQAAARHGQAAALSAELGRADGACFGELPGLSGDRWRCLPSIPAAGTARSAACAGNGKSSVPELGTSVFIIPGRTGEERRGTAGRAQPRRAFGRRGAARHRIRRIVFTYEGRPIRRMLTSGWIRARKRAGLPQVRVHDLKHTFGRRLRAAGVSFEDRQDLLGHRSGRITTHYSAAELSRLIEAANRVCEADGGQPELVVLRGALQSGSRKTPARACRR